MQTRREDETGQQFSMICLNAMKVACPIVIKAYYTRGGAENMALKIEVTQPHKVLLDQMW